MHPTHLTYPTYPTYATYLTYSTHLTYPPATIERCLRPATSCCASSVAATRWSRSGGRSAASAARFRISHDGRIARTACQANACPNQMTRKLKSELKAESREPRAEN